MTRVYFRTCSTHFHAVIGGKITHFNFIETRALRIFIVGQCVALYALKSVTMHRGMKRETTFSN